LKRITAVLWPGTCPMQHATLLLLLLQLLLSQMVLSQMVLLR
jgi:hypothetical protein